MDQTWTQWTVKAQAAQAQKLTDQASTTLASTRGNVNERTTKCTIQKLLLQSLQIEENRVHGTGAGLMRVTWVRADGLKHSTYCQAVLDYLQGVWCWQHIVPPLKTSGTVFYQHKAET